VSADNGLHVDQTASCLYVGAVVRVSGNREGKSEAQVLKLDKTEHKYENEGHENRKPQKKSDQGFASKARR
jgi:hypothetical protein